MPQTAIRVTQSNLRALRENTLQKHVESAGTCVRYGTVPLDTNKKPQVYRIR